jgi:hypothetical protein
LDEIGSSTADIPDLDPTPETPPMPHFLKLTPQGKILYIHTRWPRY